VKTVRKVTRIDGNNALQAFKPKVRVAAYCRVSTDIDEQMASLEAQKDHYESYIKANPDWEFAGIYYDEGISGTKKENRTGLLRLLADCENKKIDFIITKSVSRFARNTTDCIEMVRKLTDLGVFIYFEKENINTQRMEGELVLTILSSLAENESLSIAENSKWSIRRRFQNGTYKISYPPYGYDYVDGKLFINKEQAEIIKRIFSEALDGKGTQKIADGLNSDKIPTKRGSHWTATTIRGILSNEKYTGDVLLQKTYTDENFKRHYNRGEKDQYMIKDHHEAIISHEEFEAAQEILKQRGKEKGVIKGSSKYQKRYPFSGKIKCAECDSSFKRRIHGSGDRKYIAWCCTKHIKDASSCSMKFIREDAIHQAFVVMINKLIFGHKFILRPLLQSLKKTNYSDNITKIQEMGAKIKENTERVQVIMGLMAKGYLEPALFNTQKNELLKEAVLLKEQKEAIKRAIDGSVTALDEVEKLLKFATKAEKQIDAFDIEIFEDFIEEIIVFSQEEIGFKMKCGLNLRERLVK
jgi:site-specific DNA recombinase